MKWICVCLMVLVNISWIPMSAKELYPLFISNQMYKEDEIYSQYDVFKISCESLETMKLYWNEEECTYQKVQEGIEFSLEGSLKEENILCLEGIKNENFIRQEWKVRLKKDDIKPIVEKVLIDNIDLLEEDVINPNQKLITIQIKDDSLCDVEIRWNDCDLVCENQQNHVEFVIPDKEGSGSLLIKVKDQWGNEQVLKTNGKLMIDNHAPSLNILGIKMSSSKVYLNKSQQLTFELEDKNVDIQQTSVQFQTLLPLAWQQIDVCYYANWFLDVDQYEDGTYWLEFKSTDDANQHSILTKEIVIDKTLPEGFFVDAKKYYSKPTELIFKMFDENLDPNQTQIQFYYEDKLIEDTIPCEPIQGGYQYYFGMNQGNGKYHMTIQGVDDAGNQSIVYEHSFELDTILPEIKTILWDGIDVINRKEPYYGSQPVNVDVYFKDDIKDIDTASVKVSLSESHQALNTSWNEDCLSFELPLNCIYESLQLSIADKAGNKLEYQLPFYFYLENQSATITSDEKQHYISIDDEYDFQIKIQDDTYDPTLMEFQIRYDGTIIDTSKWEEYGFKVEKFSDCIQIHVMKKLSREIHTYEFHVTGVDLCGNSYAKTFEYVDDAIAPQITSVWLNPYVKDGGNIVFSKKAKLKLEIDDDYLDLNQTHIWIKHNDQFIEQQCEWNQNLSHYEVALDYNQSGFYQLVVETRDLSQNKQTQEIVFIVDQEAPTVKIQYANGMIDQEQIITWNWQDKHSSSLFYMMYDGQDARRQTIEGSGTWYGIQDKQRLAQFDLIEILKWDDTECSIKIKNDFKGQFRYYVKDVVNHQTRIFQTPMMVVETIDNIDDKIKISYQIKEPQDGKVYGLDAYANNIHMNIHMEAAFSGLKQIELSGMINKSYTASDFEKIGYFKDGYCIGINIQELLQAKQNGIQILYMKVYDQANVSKELSYRFVIDQQKPILMLTTSHQGITNQDVNVSLDVIEDAFQHKNLEYRLLRNGQKEEANWIWDHNQAKLTFQKEGTYELVLRLKDDVNQYSKWISMPPIVIDKTKPKITIHKEISYYVATPQSITICIQEEHFDESLVTFVRNGTFNKSTWQHENDKHYLTFATTQDGNYRLKIEMEDLAGNRSDVIKPIEFIVDSIKPKIYLSNLTSYQSRNQPFQPMFYIEETYLKDCIVTLKGKYHQSQIILPINQEKDKLYYDLGMIKEDDIYQLQVDGSDMANNQIHFDCTFTLNQKGSQFTLLNELLNDKYLTKQEKLRIQIDNLDIVDIVGFRVNGKVAPYTFKNGILETIEPLPQGLQVIQVQTLDGAHNYNEMEPITIVCDDTLPSAKITMNGKSAKSIYWKEVEVNVQTEGEDELGSIYINGEVYDIQNKQNEKISFNQAGLYEIEVHLKDQAGHTNILPLIRFRIINPYPLAIGVIFLLVMMIFLYSKRKYKKKDE